MNLNDYFEPVSLERTEEIIKVNDEMFGRNITIHTESTPIDEISNYQIAIFGVCEDRNSNNTGSAAAPDKIRQKLYELYRINDKVRIIDLGNLKISEKPEDAYFGVRDVMTDLLNNQVTAIVLGGTQDITRGLFMAYEQRESLTSITNVDARIDMEEGALSSFSWSIPVLNSNRLFRFSALGHQQYLVKPSDVKCIQDKGFEVIRLGMLRSKISMAEPVMRDSNLISFDIGALRQTDAPGTRFSSPNGFAAEEACQLARYAGSGDHVSCFGLFEVNPEYDRNFQTSHLAAQVLWYFIEGYSQRKKEKPQSDTANFKTFLVSHQDMEHALTFYKSLVTGRWWMEIPDMKSGENMLVACSQDEYQQACNHDIPEMWWKAFQRIN